ncbi:MAG: anthranilate synthase component I family protein [Pirellulales bacterium]
MIDSNSLPAPLFEPLDEPLDAEQAWLRLIDRPHVLFLDSAVRDGDRGRFSFVTADPFDYVELPADEPRSMAILRELANRWRSATLSHLPPFQGGWAGVFAYELGRSLERLPRPRFNEFQFPAVALGAYDVVLAFEHATGRAWIISHGFPAADESSRRQRAQARIREFRRWLARSEAEVWRSSRVGSSLQVASGVRGPSVAPRSWILAEELAPQFPTAKAAGLTSNFSEQDYLRAVERAVEYIRAGDVFQVNLSQRLLHPAVTDSVQLYRRLRQRNAAPFAGYFDTGEFQVVSASPERFLSVQGGRAEARPIKGTRRRSPNPQADLFTGDELLASEKDRAENIMIVDLLRNDLSTVCRPESLRVTKLCGLEVYEYVQHLVSIVEGELEPGCTGIDLLANAFPGGSITGAPKVRAMEIIAELEPTARGPYCGSLGYLGFDGSLDLSILIRTITAGRGWWQLPAGGGVVAQSDPRREYEETWHKAAGLLKALAE